MAPRYFSSLRSGKPVSEGLAMATAEKDGKV